MSDVLDEQLKRLGVALSWMLDETRSDEKRHDKALEDFRVLTAEIRRLRARVAELEASENKMAALVRMLLPWTEVDVRRGPAYPDWLLATEHAKAALRQRGDAGAREG